MFDKCQAFNDAVGGQLRGLEGCSPDRRSGGTTTVVALGDSLFLQEADDGTADVFRAPFGQLPRSLQSPESVDGAARGLDFGRVRVRVGPRDGASFVVRDDRCLFWSTTMTTDHGVSSQICGIERNAASTEGGPQ